MSIPFLQKLIHFLRHDVWHDGVFEGAGRFSRWCIRAVRMIILEWKLFFQNGGLTSASALSFSTIIALIPLLAVVFLVFKMFDGRNLLQTSIKPVIYTFLAPGAGDKLTDSIDGMLQSATVDALGIIGFIFLLGSVYLLLSSIEEAFNRIWNVKRNRSFVDQLRSYGALLVVIPLMTILSVVVSSQVGEVGESLVGGFSTFFAQTLFPYLMVVLTFYALIRIMPNCRIDAGKAWYGSFLGAALYVISKEIFVYYTTMAVSTNIIYGSLAALPIFFLWLYIIWCIVLFAVQVVYVHHNLDHLVAIERSPELGRGDELRVGLMSAMVLARDSLDPVNVHPGSTIPEIALLLGAPDRDVRNLVLRMERAQLLVRVAAKEERFILRISPERCTLGMLLDAIDRGWLGRNHYPGEDDFPVFSRLFGKNRLRRKAFRKMPLDAIIDLNSTILTSSAVPAEPAARDKENKLEN